MSPEERIRKHVRRYKYNCKQLERRERNSRKSGKNGRGRSVRIAEEPASAMGNAREQTGYANLDGDQRNQGERGLTAKVFEQFRRPNPKANPITAGWEDRGWPCGEWGDLAEQAPPPARCLFLVRCRARA